MPLNLVSKPLTPVDEDFLAQVQEFTESKVCPGADEWERDHVQPELVREAIGRFTRYYIPKQLGGEGASAMTLSCGLEAMAWGDYGFTFAYQVHNAATTVISKTPNTAMRDRYLPKLMSGEMIASLLLTEPEAGSDAGSIRTSAVRREDGKWVLNGEKAWITNAGTADLLLVFAQAGEGTKGIVAFCVERTTPGVELVEQYDMIGAHVMATGLLRFTDCVVDEEQMAYPVGEAFRAGLGGIDFARLAVASMCNGAYRQCLEVALEYAKQRVQFKAPIYKNQAIQFKLTDEVTRLEACRLLTYQAAKQFDDGASPSLMVAHCKKFVSLTSFDGAVRAMQCMGSNGLSRHFPIVRQVTGMAVSFNTDGTNDICNLVIGRAI